MNLLNWLNKLGILRWGATAATYHNALERPIELQDPGVFNAERDLVGGSDKHASQVDAKQSKPASPEKRR